MGQYLNSRSSRFSNCGNCGEEVLSNAKACPACGADESTGLLGLEDSYAVEFPAENFDYDDFMKREFGILRHVKPSHLKWHYYLVGLLLLILLVLGVLIKLGYWFV